MNRLSIPMSLLLALTAACGAATPAATRGPATISEPTTFAEQVALGQELYGRKCAGCHGADGSGSSKGPRLVGLDKGALPLEPRADAKVRTEKFVTVADVGGFASKTMPPGAAGSLSSEEYFSVLAFAVKANGIDLSEKLDGTVATELTIRR